MSNGQVQAQRLIAWLRGHPPCAWPVASTVAMALHGVNDTACAPKKANKVWAAMLRLVNKWSAQVEPFHTQPLCFAHSVMDPRNWVFFVFPGVDHAALGDDAAPPPVDPREMAFFLRCLDPIMHGDSGAVLSRCIASGNATTLEEVAIVEAFITNLRRRPETVAVLRLELPVRQSAPPQWNTIRANCTASFLVL